MTLTAEDLRTAVAGQWLGGSPVRVHAPRVPGASESRVPLVVTGVGTDTREPLKDKLFVALRGEQFDAHQFLAKAAEQGAVAALVDRKAAAYERPSNLPLLEVADTRVALGDLARYWRGRLRGKVVAVTGSSGKTTTRRMIDVALRTRMTGSASPKSFNNDVGVPLTVLGAASDDGYLVVEIGMNHPGEIAPLSVMTRPNVAVITMVGRAHLGGMGSMDAIVAEKASIVDGLSTNGVVVVNGDLPTLVAAVQARVKPGVRVVTFGQSGSAMWRLSDRRAIDETQTFRVHEPDGTTWECALGLAGDFNAVNALAAVAVARMMGVSQAEASHALGMMRPTEMRMTRQQVGDVSVFNDAYNANPDAVLASLRAFAEVAASAPRRVTVLGDMLELGDEAAVEQMHAEVGRAAVASAPDVAVFVGTGSAHGAAAARKAVEEVRAEANFSGARSPRTVVVHVPQLDDAGVAVIAQHLRAGDAVLLKGSRGSRMERLVAALESRLAVPVASS